MAVNLPPRSIINSHAVTQKEMSSDKWAQDLKAARSAKTFSTPICKQFYCKLSTRTGDFRKRDNMVSGVMRERHTLSNLKGLNCKCNPVQYKIHKAL